MTVMVAVLSVTAPAWATHEYVQGSALYTDGGASKVVMEGTGATVQVKGVNVPAPLPGDHYVLMAGTRHYPSGLPCYSNRRVVSPPLTRQADGTIAPVTLNVSVLEGLGIDDWELCFYEQPFRVESTAVTNPVYLFIFSTTH